MKRKYLYGKFLFSTLVTLFVTAFAYGQEINLSDTIKIYKDIPVFLPTIIPEYTIDKYQPFDGTAVFNASTPTPEYNFKPGIYPDYYPNKTPLLHTGDFNVGGSIVNFKSSMIYSTGQQETLPGLGRINNVSVGYLHSFDDRFIINVQGHLIKSSIPFFRGQSFGTSGVFSYQMNDHIRFNAFGSYYHNPTSLFNSRQFGSSMTVGVTERFSTEVGVRRSYDSMHRRWETIPVFTPTYKVKKVELGVDVGSILHYLILK